MFFIVSHLLLKPLDPLFQFLLNLLQLFGNLFDFILLRLKMPLKLSTMCLISLFQFFVLLLELEHFLLEIDNDWRLKVKGFDLFLQFGDNFIFLFDSLQTKLTYLLELVVHIGIYTFKLFNSAVEFRYSLFLLLVVLEEFKGLVFLVCQLLVKLVHNFLELFLFILIPNGCFVFFLKLVSPIPFKLQFCFGLLEQIDLLPQEGISYAHEVLIIT